MKPLYLLLLLLPVTGIAIAQPAKKVKTKAPTQKDMESAKKEAEDMMAEMMKDMSDEDKRMMDSMGIKMPDLKKVKVPKVTDGQLAAAWENEDRIVPRKDAARIAAIPKPVATARVSAYIAAIQQKLLKQFNAKTIAAGNALYTDIQRLAKSQRQAGSMAIGCWLSGQPELTLYVLGRICSADAGDVDNLSNYTAALTMLGGEHLAIPLLNNLNTRYRRNSTVLNNLGQAWFGLGDMVKAEKYLDSVTAIYPFHPQANLTKASIEESKGNTPKAIECVKKSIRHSYTKEKEEQLRKLGYKLTRIDLRLPFKPSSDPLGLSQSRRPDYPTSIAQIDALLPYWKQFNAACDAKIEKIDKEKAALMVKYNQSYGDQAKQAMAVIQQGGVPVIVEPPFMKRASLQLQAYEKYYSEMFKQEAARYMQLQTDLAAIRKQNAPVGDYVNCSTHRDRVNKLLKALNERKKTYDESALKLFRRYCNDMAYWSLYTSVDANAYRIIELDFQKVWLQKNREYQPLDMNDYAGAYKDCVDKEEGKPGKLAEFDDVACNYKATLDFWFVEEQMNCSHTTTVWKLGDNSYTSRELGTKHIGSTIKVKPTLGVDGNAGPLGVEASISGDFTIELDAEHQVKDWNGTVSPGVGVSVGVEKDGVKGEAGVKLEIEVEVSQSRGVGDVNMVGTAEAGVGALGQKISVGVQDRVSLISGHGSVKGIGSLGTTTLSEW